MQNQINLKGPAHRFAILDSFRGFGALFVVILHIDMAHSFGVVPFFRHGYIAVPFFFTLSGFVLAFSVASNFGGFRAFMIKRVIRVFPLHLFALFFLVLISMAKIIAQDLLHVPFAVPINSAQFFEVLPANIFLLQNITPLLNPKHIPSINGPSWSLSVEMFLYALLGACMVLGLFVSRGLNSKRGLQPQDSKVNLYSTMAIRICALLIGLLTIFSLVILSTSPANTGGGGGEPSRSPSSPCL